MQTRNSVAVIGGGAAGFFMAVNLKRACPALRVVVLEGTRRPLAKVLVSGGGRCNVTNTFEQVAGLEQVYPRGSRLLRRLFRTFGPADAFRWFESAGVPLTVQPDGCVFPRSQDAHSIAECLSREAARIGVELLTEHKVCALTTGGPQGKWCIAFGTNGHTPMYFDCVAVTCGGSSRREGLRWLEELGHSIESPVPSLFTFSVPHNGLRALMGTVVSEVSVAIPGTRFRACGPLLVTHWGLSGPAVLLLSAYAARHVATLDYRFKVSVNWTGSAGFGEVADALQRLAEDSAQKKWSSLRFYGLPARLWMLLLERAGLDADRKVAETGRKGLNKLLNALTNDEYDVEGRAPFKDEFVTCGGVSLRSVCPDTMESRHCSGLYFAGEVLDVDGVTGGFNFQAAWTTAYVAAQAIARRWEQ